MKTAISLSDSLFDKAESLAKHLGISRSALYSAALEAYILQRDEEAITRRLNEVYSDTSSESETETLSSLTKHSTQLYDKW